MTNLNDSAVSGGSSIAVETLLRDACDELERRLRVGEAVRVEEFFTRHPVLCHDPEQAMDLIFVEYATRRESGEALGRDEFFARFPQWHAFLQRQFQFDDFIDAENSEKSRMGDASRLREAPLRPSGLTATSQTLSTGRPESRFRVLRLFALGGIGQVMRAMDTELNREVAVKQLQPSLAGSDALRERFLREAEITGKLEHPGIVPVYGLGRDDQGRPFYAMRLVRGQSFHEAVAEFHKRSAGDWGRFGLEFQKLLRRFLHVCETVAYAHSRGVIHRDLKPANIMLGPFGETLLVDWGLASVIGASGPRTDHSRKDGPVNSDLGPQQVEGDGQLTPVANWADDLTQADGQVIGTPAFMSPEQARGEARAVGPASDVYSLGATLYMLLTGNAPVAGSSVEESLRTVISSSFIRPRELSREIPPTLEAVCLKAMALRPEDRYVSPRELADDLEHWLADEPVSAGREPIVARLARWGRRHRARVVAAAIALVLITLVSVVASFRINGERLRADGERLEADRQRIDADRQRITAERERNEANYQRIEANRRTARLAFDRGVALTRDHEHGEGMLWFARALEHAPEDYTALRRVILTNLDAARHYLLHRHTVFANAGTLGRMAFSPDGKRLVTTNLWDKARLWDVESGAMLSERKLPGSRRSSVSAVQVFDDGSAIVAVVTDRTVSVQRLPADEAVPTEPPVAMQSNEKIDWATFSPDGSVLATGGPSKSTLWRASDGERLGDIAHPTSISQLLFRPHSREVATRGVDGKVRFWELSDGSQNKDFCTLVREIQAEGRQVDRIAFTPDGRGMLGGVRPGLIAEWDVETGRRLPDLAKRAGLVTAIAIASDGKTVLAAWDTGVAQVWNRSDGAAFCEQLRLDRYEGHLAFRPGTRQVLIAEQQTAVLWNVPDPEHSDSVPTQRQVNSIAISPDGKKAITGGRDKTAWLRKTTTGIRFGAKMKHDGVISQVAFRPDGAVVLTTSRDGTAQLWSSRTGKKHGPVMDHRLKSGDLVSVQAGVFSPDGQLVLTGDSSGVLRAWNGDTGELVRVFDEFKDPVNAIGSICFNSSGDRVAAGFGNGQVGLWDALSGKVLWSIRHGNRVRSVDISPDGRMVISASNNETARVWNTADGQPLGPELRHRGQVFVAKFSPSPASRLALTASFDATVRLWDVPSGRPVGEPIRHNGAVATAAFSRDGTRLLTGGTRDRTARLWDVAMCLPLAPPLEHDEDVFAVAIHPAGHVAFTGRFWRLPAPLPDDRVLIDLWVKLATQRTFTQGDNIEWLDRDAVAFLAAEFQARTGKSWSEWADEARESFSRTALEAYEASLRAQ